MMELEYAAGEVAIVCGMAISQMTPDARKSCVEALATLCRAANISEEKITSLCSPYPVPVAQKQ